MLDEMDPLDLFVPLDHDVDLDDEDPICVVVPEFDDYPIHLEVLDEWVEDSMRLIDGGGGRLAYYGVRHCLELGLKVALHVPGGGWTNGHGLEDLRKELEKSLPDHPLFSDDEDAVQLRHFIAEIDERDPGGDEGRYARRREGTLAFDGECHIPRDRLRLCLLLAQELLQPLPVS